MLNSGYSKARENLYLSSGWLATECCCHGDDVVEDALDVVEDVHSRGNLSYVERGSILNEGKQRNLLLLEVEEVLFPLVLGRTIEERAWWWRSLP